MFEVDKGEVGGRRGWIVRHRASQAILSGERPFATQRVARRFAERLPGLTKADGHRFDWVAAGVPERLAGGRGPDGRALTAELTTLRRDAELEAFDERKPQPSGAQSPFGSVTALRMHLRREAASYVGGDVGEAWRLTVIAAAKTLGIAPRGQLIYWRHRPRSWVIATPLTAGAVTQLDISEQREAHELAAWIETQVVDATGVPFPVGAPGLAKKSAGCRSVRWLSLDREVRLARAEFDRFKGRSGTWAIGRAYLVEEDVASQEAIARRAAAGGYATGRPSGLVRRDQIEFDITVVEANRKLFVGGPAPRVGDTVTLRGVIASRVSRTENGIGVAFERGGVSWSDAGGRGGTVLGDAWHFGAYDYPEPVIYRRRSADIDAIGPEAWHWHYAEALADQIGLSDTAIVMLRRAVEGAFTSEFERAAFSGAARAAYVELRDVSAAELDRALMSLRGSLDEYEARGGLEIKLRDSATAALLLALAAARRRRAPHRLDREYWSCPAHAGRLRQHDPIDPASLNALAPRARHGARVYAEARLGANAGWRPHARTQAMDADGDAWQRTAAALDAARAR